MNEHDDADDLEPVTEPVEPIAPPEPTRTPEQLAALDSFRASMQSLPDDIGQQIAAFDAEIRSPWSNLGGVLDPVPMPPPLTGLLSRQHPAEDAIPDAPLSPPSPLPSPTTIEYRDRERIVPDYSRPAWASTPTPTISSPAIVPASPTPLMGAAFIPAPAREPVADLPDLPSYREMLDTQLNDAGLTHESMTENIASESIVASAMAGPVTLPILPPEHDVPSPSPLPPIPPSVPLPMSPVGLPAAARPTLPDALAMPSYRDLVADVTGSDFSPPDAVDSLLSPPAMPSPIMPMSEALDPPSLETRPVGPAFTQTMPTPPALASPAIPPSPSTPTRTTTEDFAFPSYHELAGLPDRDTPFPSPPDSMLSAPPLPMPTRATTEDADDTFDIPSYREMLQSSLPSPSWLDDRDGDVSPPLTIPPSVVAGLTPPTMPTGEAKADVASPLPIPPAMPTRPTSTSMPPHLDYRAQLRSEYPALYGTTSATTDAPGIPTSTPPSPLEFPSYHQQMRGDVGDDAMPIPPSMPPAFDTMPMPPSSMPHFAEGMTPPSASAMPPATQFDFPNYHTLLTRTAPGIFPPSRDAMEPTPSPSPFPSSVHDDDDPLASLFGPSIIDGHANREQMLQQLRQQSANDPLSSLFSGGLADMMSQSFGSAGTIAEGGSSKTDELLEKILRAIEGLGQGGQGSSYSASGSGPLSYHPAPMTPIDLEASEGFSQSSPSISVSVLAGAGGLSGGRGREVGSRTPTPQSLLSGGQGRPAPAYVRSSFYEPGVK